MTQLSRRALLGGVVSLGTASLSGPVFAWPWSRPKFEPGVQIYTVREAFATDPQATLKKVHAMGYRSIEMAGLAGRKASEVKTWVDDIGLKVRSGHVGDWYNYAEPLLDELAVLGASWAVVPWMPEEERANWPAFAAKMNRWGELARVRGMKLAYHNHDFEFRKVGDRSGFEVLVAETDPALVSFELDCYWAIHGGQNPVQMMRDHAGRIGLLHLKDMTSDRAMAPVGVGTIDYRAILRAAHKAGVAHAFVEQDDAEANGRDGFASLARSIRTLSSY